MHPRKRVPLIVAETISPGGDHTSNAFSIPFGHGNFAITWDISGSGTAKFEVLSSIDDDEYIAESGMPPIAEGQTAGKGKGTVYLGPSTSFKIKVTETGTTDSITVSAAVLSME